MLDIVGGWEPRESLGFQVAQFSAIRRTSQPLRFTPLMEKALRYNGLYRRPHEMRDGQLWCPISNAPMATSFANSRFLVPWLELQCDWALFCDFADMLFLADPVELFALADANYAVQVVKREHVPVEQTKMDAQAQTVYPRKNWSSVVLWNLRHAAHQKLTLGMVNELPGRDLHRFCWLEDDEIGDIPLAWNFLAGVDPAGIEDSGQLPKLLHYTTGTPELLGPNCPHAAEWLRELAILDATRGRIVA